MQESQPVVPTEDGPAKSGRQVQDSKNFLKKNDVESAIDVSGKVLDFQGWGEDVRGDDSSSVEGLYLYKNIFNLIPRSIGGLGRLKTLKFFANEIALFPAEFRNLVDLECLQVKISLPGLTGLPLHKLQSLTELDLSMMPPRPSAFPLIGEIAGLRRLTKLSVCHFSIRYLPPEIGCLNYLEFLDLSHNKMRSIPTEISYLNLLITLKVANNKLVDLPSTLSSLQRLENLDLSNNRLASLGRLELNTMHNLRILNLQYNKLLRCTQIPSWIFCNLEGNREEDSNDEFFSSSVEMDVLESAVQEIRETPVIGPPIPSMSHLAGSSTNIRCFGARKSRKGWKRRYYLQQRARQERLNCSRKWKVEGSTEVSSKKAAVDCEPCKKVVLSDSLAEGLMGIVGSGVDDKESLAGEPEDGSSLVCVDDDCDIKKVVYADNCSCISVESVERCEDEDNCSLHTPLESLSNVTVPQDQSLCIEVSNGNLKSKRHSEKDLNNPKPRKSRRPADTHLDLSSKYSTFSFCSSEEYLPDGFYDAGRDRPFLPLTDYEKVLHLSSREVIVLDREKDEELDATAICAQALLFRFKQMYGSMKERGQVSIDILQVASLLALFVSDHLGGSDRSSTVQRARKFVSGSNYSKPFVCTCPTGNGGSTRKSADQSLNSTEEAVLGDLCERSLQSIKERRNSIVVPIGTLQFGVCRHRALLMKYLCDRMKPRVPCELVRGYLDFSPHAWNVIHVKRGGSQVRMIVDACHPHDIREEADPEYFCRYIPLSRVNVTPMVNSDLGVHCSFPSLSVCEENKETSATTLMLCKFGSLEAAAKVRTLDVSGASADKIKHFEFSCLGEVRILSALKHPCIVEIFGHQISTKWAPSANGVPDHRILQSSIFMERIEGGSLKNFLKKLARDGKNHAPLELALDIARDVAWALAELHSKHIIHRDVKSENVLIDLDQKRSDGKPVVKLCDFDRAIPLRSGLHTCCIAHIGIHPADVCVGTPRWMAPEVLRTLHDQHAYGLEVDIWSFGCLLLELLTLQMPYSGLSETDIHDHLLMGKRPPLTAELEKLGPVEDTEGAQSARKQEEVAQSARKQEEEAPEEAETLRFLVDVYRQCTKENPTERPTSDDLYQMLSAHSTCHYSRKAVEA